MSHKIFHNYAKKDDRNSGAPVVNYQQTTNPVHLGQPVYYQQQQVIFIFVQMLYEDIASSLCILTGSV